MTSRKTPPLRVLSLLAISGLLAMACSTASEQEATAPPTGKKGETVRSICFSNSIDSFSMTTRESIIVSKSRKEQYLLEIYGGCSQLRNAQRIGFSSTGSCVRRGDRIIVSDTFFSNDTGIGPERCVIRNIYKWEKNEPKEAELPETES